MGMFKFRWRHRGADLDRLAALDQEATSLIKDEVKSVRSEVEAVTRGARLSLTEIRALSAELHLLAAEIQRTADRRISS